jgi:hypothetical protein
MTSSAAGLSYRRSQVGDLPGIQRLWAEESGWGPLGDKLQQWYGMNPFRGSFTVVALDSAEGIVGEFVFMARDVIVNGAVYRAIRPIAPIVSRSLRFPLEGGWREHPVFRMYGLGVELAAQDGFALLFSLPNPGWQKLLRPSSNGSATVFPLWSLRLPKESPSADAADCKAGPVENWDAEVDDLWTKTAADRGCLAVRDAATLRWKALRTGFEATAIRVRGQLIGLVLSQTSAEQWLICDLLAAGESAVRKSVAAVCALAEERSAAMEKGYPKVAILATPALQEPLAALGFSRDQYDFPFMVRGLSSNLQPEAIAAEHWYVSAND